MSKKPRTAAQLMDLAPFTWQETADSMSAEERRERTRDLEAIAHRAAMLAAYIDARHGYGCGDQGHKSAVKAANKAGRTVWCKAFGYNAHHDLSM